MVNAPVNLIIIIQFINTQNCDLKNKLYCVKINNPIQYVIDWFIDMI